MQLFSATYIQEPQIFSKHHELAHPKNTILLHTHTHQKTTNRLHIDMHLYFKNVHVDNHPQQIFQSQWIDSLKHAIFPDKSRDSIQTLRVEIQNSELLNLVTEFHSAPLH